ncbi:MAG: hypothetical protein ACKPKO_13950, partial [Candidatus Fonsibacter sp.]
MLVLNTSSKVVPLFEIKLDLGNPLSVASIAQVNKINDTLLIKFVKPRTIFNLIVENLFLVDMMSKFDKDENLTVEEKIANK